jgi:hypothetical protein
MARKIAFESLPAWAQENIRKASPFGNSQITRDEGSLSIQNGKARFNDIEVAAEGDLVDSTENAEETIHRSNLPAWAIAKVLRTPVGSTVQMTVNGDSLQITRDGKATFNGMQVEK